MKNEEIYPLISEYINQQNKTNKIKEKLDQNMSLFIEEKELLIKEKFIEKFNKSPNIYTDISLYKIKPIIFYIEGLEYVYPMDDGSWVKYDLEETLDQRVEDWELKIVDIGISHQEIIDFIENLSNSLDIKIELKFKHKELPEDIEFVKDKSDIKILYPDAKIIENGEVWFKGWDICDRWVIYENQNKQYITWSDNGHGFGMDYIIESPFNKNDINQFLNHVMQDENNFFLTEWIVCNLNIKES